MRAKPTTLSGDWSRYLYSDMHQGNNPNETILTTTYASSLTLKWKFQTAGALIGEPIIVNGIIYQGSGDGYLYAIGAAEQQVWKTFLGRHSIASCPVAYGITATAAVENGKVYIGLASDCDKPLIQGMLYAPDATRGTVVAEAKMVPNGNVGGGIWSTPTIDAATGTVIITTGSIEKSPPILPMTAAVVTLDWNTLSVKQSWQVPAADGIKDADWESTPTLFPGPNGKSYFGCVNKNSIYCVFDEANVSAGPIWQIKPGVGGALARLNASFPSSAYVNGVLFIAGVQGVDLPAVNEKLYVFGL